jgi:hypothetical protein
MLNTRSHLLAIGVVVTACVGGGPAWAQGPSAETAEYNPVINPGDFVPQIDNKYFTLKPGSKFTYQDKRGIERIELTVTDEKRNVMGVPTTAVRVTEWRHGLLKEDTTDWYAQDKSGNVWYFGESVNNYKDGQLVHRWGSWEAGVDGAKPGIIMRGNPQVGDTYRQEYSKGYAEDMGTVVATDKTITTPHGRFENCLQIRDWSQVESGTEFKYYCPEVGFLVREETARGGVLADLVSVSRQ